jgi:uncharacterized protein YggE
MDLELMKKLVLVIFIALLSVLSLSSNAQITERTIITSGEGKVSVAPDMAELNMQLQTINKDGNKAKTDLDAQLNRLLAALAPIGISSTELIASTLQLNPQYEYQNKRRQFVGYRASRNVAVNLSRLDQLNLVMETALAAGVDQLGRVNFKIADESQYKKQAQQQAIDQSKRLAKQLAESYDATLGPIVQITYQGSDIQYPRPMTQLRQHSDTSMRGHTEPGIYLHDNITFTDRISVIFELIIE